jgi:hypothetical protein
MNETWNNLKKSVAEREKKLDECLIRSGKFQVSMSQNYSFPALTQIKKA